MGRVYDIRPDATRGELPGARCRVTVHTVSGYWVQMPYVVRVEFDHDGDAGPATVFFLVRIGDRVDEVGRPDEAAAARASVRCLARVTRPAAPAAESEPFVEPVMVEVEPGRS